MPVFYLKFIQVRSIKRPNTGGASQLPSAKFVTWAFAGDFLVARHFDEGKRWRSRGQLGARSRPAAAQSLAPPNTPAIFLWSSVSTVA